MTDAEPTNDTLPAPKPANKTLPTALSSDGGGIVFHTVAEARDIAYLMAGSDKAVRKHLRNNPGACFGIVIQAVEWGLSPYAVANKSYEVNDQLAYESQLIQAVILRRAPIKGRIKYAFEGEDNKRVCIASAVTTEGETVEYRSPELGKITPKNSPLWKNDPDQQQCYYSGRALCRRHFPDVLLGIYDVDELEASRMRDVTPKPSGLADRLVGGGNGFNAEGVEAALGGERASPEPEDDDQGNDVADGDVAAPETAQAGDEIEARREGNRAFWAGNQREAPADYTEGEQLAWLQAWDEASDTVEAAQ